MTHHLLKNWRSTVAGIAMILSALVRIHAAADLAKSDIQAELLGGIGLICSADSKSGDPAVKP